LEVVEFLLGLYPEAASVMTSNGCNLLRLTVEDEASRALLKVQYLCSRYPAMIQQRDGGGELPVHRATLSSTFKAMLVMYEAGGIEQFKTPIAHPTNAGSSLNGYLPLHRFVSRRSLLLRDGSQTTLSEDAETFRWLLRLYPEAAGIEGGKRDFKCTPYQRVVSRKLPDYYRRLLLRAAPTLNPAELRRLNYKERRMAMFLAFKAVTATTEVPLLVRLRGESKDLVQRVVSFL
jgi:hypothetical protein